MRRSTAVGVLLWVVAIALASTATAFAQDNVPIGAGRGPQFLLAMGPSQRPVPVDVASVPVLRRRVSLDLKDVSRAGALDAISQASGLRLVYANDVTLREGRVRLKVEGITVAAALTEVLLDAGVDVLLARSGNAVLVRRTAVRVPAAGAIVGLVSDAKTSQGIARAEVLLAGTRSRTLTDTAGRYRLLDIEPGNYTLTVRRIGYSKQSRTVTVHPVATDTVNLVLDPVPTRLNELVTTATGARRRLEVANDITRLNADSIVRTQPITSVTDLLEGRVPGLVVQRTSGAPGDPARLRLRGAASPLRSNDPIVIVDGVRIYSEQSAARSANLAGIGDTANRSTNNAAGAPDGYATPSPLDYIDPNSIETIEVVKGPSAATLYGQDAANGVIVITTKKGKAGPTQWTASADHGRTRIEGKYPELYLRWGHLWPNDTRVPCKLDNTVAGFFGGEACVGDSLVAFQLLNDPDLTVLDAGHHTGLTLGASGGSSALTYAVTGSYQDALGLPKLPDYEAERFEARTGAPPPDWMRRPQHLTQWGVSSRISARLGATADLSLQTSFSRTLQQRSSLEQQFGSLMSLYLDRATGIYYQAYSGSFGVANQVLTTYYERATAAATQFTPGVNLNWRPRPWLTFTGDAGLNIEQRADQIFLPRSASTGAFDSTGHLDVGQGTSLVSTVNLRANSIAPLGLGLRFQVAAGANYTGTSFNDLAGTTENLPPGTTPGTQGVVTRRLTSRTQDNATFGWYVEPSLNHARFSLSLGLRLDGSNAYGQRGLPKFTFPPKFPKLGFSYLLSDEPFFPLKDLFQTFRVRVAYGKAGRQPVPTERLRLYGATQPVYEDGTYFPAVFLQTLGNTEVRPERSTELEGGFDADLWDNRVTLSVTGYRKTTDDALLPVPVAASVYGSGLSIVKNIGVIRNTGLELTVGAQLVRSGPVTWGTQLSLSQNRNVVVKLGPGVDAFYTQGQGNDGSGTTGGMRVAPGYPLFGRWSKPILGYADANGNGVLEPSEVLMGDTAIYVGQTLPNYTATFHTTVSLWRGAVALSADFLYEDGLSQQNTVAQGLAPFSRGWNDPTASLAEQLATTNLNTGNDYNWIQTVNTMRFNDLAVTYTVPTALARRVGAQRLSVAVQGSNLGLWSNYRGLDPNVNAFNTGNSVADTGVLPQPRTWQVRINAAY